MTVITLVIVGKRSSELNPVLSDDHRKKERARPERIPLEEFAFVNNYDG